METEDHRTETSARPDGETRGRLVWVDALKAVSIFAVILLHAAAPLLLAFDPERSGGAGWWTGNLYDAAVRWSVPVFVMVSGALLLGRASDEGLKSFLGRRFARVAIPAVAWSVLYFEWQIRFWDMDLDYAELVPTLLREPIAYHLWFVYMLLGLYLLAPLLGTLFEAGRRNLEIYAVALWLVVAGVLPMADRLLGLETWYSPGRDNGSLMLIGYFLLGFMLRDVELPRWAKASLPAVFAAAVAITAGSTYLLTRAAGGEYQPLFYEYYSLNVVAMAVAVFLGAASLPGLREASADSRRARFWRFLSERVFGVYLIHVLILDVLKEGTLGFTLDHTTFHPALAVPLLAVIGFGGSLVLVLGLERIPGVRRVLV